ncbi:hypothetical protein BT69DRAFT_626046 [Atractiella rhizophila]|nr:hypothetical protein BT69DRAFT_626046 [Atractiella rhizophila]
MVKNLNPSHPHPCPIASSPSHRESGRQVTRSSTPRLEKRQVPAPIVKIDEPKVEQPRKEEKPRIAVLPKPKELEKRQVPAPIVKIDGSRTPRAEKMEFPVLSPVLSEEPKVEQPRKEEKPRIAVLPKPKEQKERMPLGRSRSEQPPRHVSVPAPISPIIAAPTSTQSKPAALVSSPQSQSQTLSSSVATNDTAIEHPASIRSTKSIPTFFRSPSMVSMKRTSIALPPALSNATAIIDEFNHVDTPKTAPITGGFNFQPDGVDKGQPSSVPTKASKLKMSPATSPSLEETKKLSPRKRQSSTSEDLTRRLKTISSTQSLSTISSGQKTPGTPGRMSSLGYFPNISRIFHPASISKGKGKP